MKRFAWTFGICLVLLLGIAAVTPAPAQDTGEAQSAEEQAKAKAREDRIQEYLRKKEERRLRREAEQARKEEEAEAKRTQKALENGRTPSTETYDEAAVEQKRGQKKQKPRPRAERNRTLPKPLARLHENLVATPFGQDPTVAPYLDLIGRGEASAQQIAAFGNFLGQAGRNEAALAYYDLALSIDDEDPTIWVNAGTLQRQLGNLQAAAGAYSQALGIDPSHAYGHYNLGAVLDEMGDYDNAIEEYKLALVLDPDLGDPAKNPQAANNEKLVAVRLMLYKEQAGSLGLPLVTVPDGEVENGN